MLQRQNYDIIIFIYMGDIFKMNMWSNYSVAHSFFNLCVIFQENEHFDLYH